MAHQIYHCWLAISQPITTIELRDSAYLGQQQATAFRSTMGFRLFRGKRAAAVVKVVLDHTNGSWCPGNRSTLQPIQAKLPVVLTRLNLAYQPSIHFWYRNQLRKHGCLPLTRCLVRFSLAQCPRHFLARQCTFFRCSALILFRY